VSLALLLVFFVYGLAFYAMGLAVLLESGRAASTDEAHRLSCLAAFGLIHGTHEWLEAYLLQAQSVGADVPGWLGWCRLGLLVLSFSCLSIYAFLSLRQVSPKYRERVWHFGPLAVWASIVLMAAFRTYRDFPVPWPTLADATSRYVLAVPAAVLAALALRAHARAAEIDGRGPVAASLRVGAFGFAIYSLTQLFVPPLGVFPANIINQRTFLSLTGLPIQAIRAPMAALITFGVLRALQAVERERQSELVVAHQSRIAALEQRDGLRRDLLRHVVRSQEEERARVARELHDETAQLLSAFSLELGALRTKLRRPEATRTVDRLQDLSRQMSQGLYRLMRDLRPSHLDNLGLVPALNFLLSQDFRPKGLEVSFDVTGTPRRLNGLVETVLFRVAQESLANVVRHARVDEARVELHYDCLRVTLRILDHGRGFDPDQSFDPPRGWGLVGMRERVESMAGRLVVKSAPGQGTLVEADIPIADDQQKDLAYGPDHDIAGG
jgi:signal transduction histidine kinase